MPFFSPPVSRLCGAVLLALALGTAGATGQTTITVTTAAELAAAVTNGADGDTVRVAPGLYVLSESLRPKQDMAVIGAGAGQTVVTGSDAWTPGTAGLPDNATNSSSVNRDAYLIDLGNRRRVTIADLTLRGPNLHGAISGNDSDYLVVRGVSIEDVLWSGIRIFRVSHARIYDSTFIDAGGQYGTTGGGIYATWLEHSEIWNNTFRRSPASTRNFYGIKGRQAKYVRMHHNTIRTNFSIEWPHENDRYTEIDHNYLTGPISIPKYAGGSVPEGGFSFHIHHNYSSATYALEWVRNGAEVDHNLFDFSTSRDFGNLISAFGSAPANGPARFHNNLIKNPGRGVIWIQEVYNNLEVYNNHVIANTTATPRTDGLFGLNPNTDFSTVAIRDNIIEVNGLPRPLMRNAASRTAMIENNRLVGVSDTAGYANPQTGAPQGPAEPLFFRAGAFGEYQIDGWDIRPFEGGGAELTATLWLEGAFASDEGAMRTDLAAAGALPLAQPFGGAAFAGSRVAYSGDEAVAAMPDDAVDWVLLELRSDPTTVVAQRAALLRANGAVTGVSGSGPVRFDAPAGTYYVAAYHRNHVPAMTATPVDLGVAGGSLRGVNFGAREPYGGASTMTTLASGQQALYRGDVNADGLVTALDFNAYSAASGSLGTGYVPGDLNLDGLVTALDFNAYSAASAALVATGVPEE